jgi:deazaflavin-dependent oxidoreductase (nitroreductase family)
MTNGMDMRAFNAQLIEQYRASGGHGEMGPVHFEKLVLLTTTGRRSGQLRTVPLGGVRDGESLLLFASNMGAPRHPDWYWNIAADPQVAVETAGRTFHARAEILAGAERDDAYAKWIADAPHVADHQDRAGRVIPMVRIPLTESS